MNRKAILYAFASAALFGLSAPAAKALLASVPPALLAGLFYCGAGIGVAVLRRLSRMSVSQGHAAEASLTGHDFPWIVGAVICGGVAGPLLLMIGLAQTQAATASLLLTFEGAATALFAWIVFRENYDLRLFAGMACLLAGGALLAWTETPTWSSISGPIAIVMACIAWALDNNLTRKVSLSDPLQIVEIKGLVAGPINIAIGLLIGGIWPSPATALIAAAIGFVSYGLSLVLFILALRELGSARTSAYFGTAPFLGAIGSIIALGESITLQLTSAGALMAIGVWLHLTERHAHAHVHARTTHAHRHVHDRHHQHIHGAADPLGEPHTHTHEHEPLKHEHPHTPDMHHGHRHG